VQTAIKACTKCGREITALNTGNGRQRLNSYRNNCMLDYINGNNS